jgi:hypothetical protein
MAKSRRNIRRTLERAFAGKIGAKHSYKFGTQSQRIQHQRFVQDLFVEALQREIAKAKAEKEGTT